VIAVAIVVTEPLGRALVTAGADQTLGIGFHQDLQQIEHRKIAFAPLYLKPDANGPNVLTL
jgi:hypothetical protein